MTTLPPALLDLMSRVLRGDATSDELVSELHASRDDVAALAGDAMLRTGEATVDLGRQSRCGFGEVIYGEGKSAELVTRIIQAQIAAGQSAFVTRIDSGVAFQVRQSFNHARHSPLARTLRVSTSPAEPPRPLTTQQATQTVHAAVVTAGSTDGHVAEEAIETLGWMNVPVQRFDDIGVAGPQRLSAALPQLRLASAVVVIAGMEGALPAVVAGHLAVPVFAVPTSIGYGTNLGGLTPLMGMLCSCAANVAAVNIDAGFKGGYLAGLVVRQLQQMAERQNSNPASETERADPGSPGSPSNPAEQNRDLPHSAALDPTESVDQLGSLDPPSSLDQPDSLDPTGAADQRGDRHSTEPSSSSVVEHHA